MTHVQRGELVALVRSESGGTLDNVSDDKITFEQRGVEIIVTFERGGQQVTAAFVAHPGLSMMSPKDRLETLRADIRDALAKRHVEYTNHREVSACEFCGETREHKPGCRRRTGP